ncbi:hypothetical protein C8R47DRAFT_1152488, partial [Mycena vitilis]
HFKMPCFLLCARLGIHWVECTSRRRRYECICHPLVPAVAKYPITWFPSAIQADARHRRLVSRIACSRARREAKDHNRFSISFTFFTPDTYMELALGSRLGARRGSGCSRRKLA